MRMNLACMDWVRETEIFMSRKAGHSRYTEIEIIAMVILMLLL